jgi:hypothetical protein
LQFRLVVRRAVDSDDGKRQGQGRQNEHSDFLPILPWVGLEGEFVAVGDIMVSRRLIEGGAFLLGQPML